MSEHPPYYHEIKKADAEALVGTENGTYLLRARPSKGGEKGYLLTVVYKKKPTHHNLLQGKDGTWALNKKLYSKDGHKSADSMCKALAKPTKGWPVPLINPIMNEKAKKEPEPESEEEEEVTPEPVKPKLKKAAAKTEEKEDAPTEPKPHMMATLKPVTGGMRGAKKKEKKPKGPINFKQVEKVAKGKKGFQGLPGESPELMLPPSLLGVAGINVPAPKERKWRRSSTVGADEEWGKHVAEGAAKHGPAETMFVEVSKIKKDATESLPYFYPGCTKVEAERLVSGTVTDHPDGTFLVRKPPAKEGEAAKFAYFLTVLHKGKATHHPITKDTQKVVLINKKKFNGHKKVGDLLKELAKEGKAGWPVALTNPLLRPQAHEDREDALSSKIGSPEKLAVSTFKLHELSEAQEADEKQKEEVYNREVQDARVMTELERADAARLREEEERLGMAQSKMAAVEAKKQEVMARVIAEEESRVVAARASAVAAVHNNVAEAAQRADDAETHGDTILGKIAALKAQKKADGYVAPKVQKLTKVQLMAKAKREAELAVEQAERDAHQQGKKDAKRAVRQAEIDAKEKAEQDAVDAKKLEEKLAKMPNWKKEKYFADIKKQEAEAVALAAAVQKTKAQLAAEERENASERMQRLAQEAREREAAEKRAVSDFSRASDLTRAGGSRNELAERFAKRGASNI